MEESLPIGVRITQIKFLQGRIFESLLAKHTNMELNGSQTHILFQLWKEDDISISELSKRTDLAKTTLTSMLNRLEQAGWIQRKINPNNRRQIRIILTEDAKKMQEKYYAAYQEMSKINFCNFSEEEEQELCSYLDRLYENLTQYDNARKE